MSASLTLALLLSAWLSLWMAPAADPVGQDVSVAAAGDAAVPVRPPRDRRPLTSAELQQALDAARPGDSIILPQDGVFVGPFRLPPKDGEGWIEVRGEETRTEPGTRLRPGTAGSRIGPADRGSRGLPWLIAEKGSVIVAEPGAHHYRFIGLEISPAPGTFLYDVIDLGSTATSLETMPHHITIERSYIHGDPEKGSRRGVALNGANLAVVDSHLSDFKEVGADSQAICGWSGPGPFRIENNYLEGAGENVMFGGGDPRLPGLVPSDIVIRGNHFAKPRTWRREDARYAGVPWTVKNLFELKNARRVTVQGNLFEYNWAHGQDGMAILFTVRNQDGGSPWAVIEDVLFADNVVRHVAGGIYILGRDNNYESQPTRRIVIRNNLFLDVGGTWGSGRLLQIVDASEEVTFAHNTAFQTGTAIHADGQPHSGFVFRDNIVPHNTYGVIGSGFGIGRPSLEHYFPGAVFEGNVLVGGNPASYPAGNFFPGDFSQVRLAEVNGPGARLLAESPFRGRATNQADPGVNVEALGAAFAAAGDGRSAVARPVRPALVLFWVSLGAIAYAYIGYPMLVGLMARIRPRPVRHRPFRPAMTVIVIAHNEEGRIEARLSNLLALQYPRGLIDVIVASDGSTDDTVARARRFPGPVHVFDFPVRRGKAAVLNDTVPRARGEVVVLADARQTFAPDALEAIADAMGDPDVGAVSGELMLMRPLDAPDAAMGAAFYWRYEKMIRRAESLVDSTIGATGAIYAIRRPLFERLSEDTLLDDVVVPLRVSRRGLRVVFEPRARAYDTVAASPGAEFARKTRTMAGGFQLFAHERWVWNPIRNRLWFQTLSHKGLRLVLPLFYISALVGNVLLLDHLFFQVAFAGQMAFYALAAMGALWPVSRARLFLVRVPFTICLLTWATVAGCARFATGRQRVTWDQRAWTQKPESATAPRNAFR